MVITAIEQQKKNPERYSVFVDGEFAFGLIQQDILYFKLEEGKEIPEEKYHDIMDNIIYIKAQDRALNYLGYKMRTSHEVAVKLKEEEYTEDVIERVLEFLEKYNYVNDRNYCDCFIRQTSRLNPKGKIGLKRELKQRRIKESVINEALEENGPCEEEKALGLLMKKTRGLLPENEKAKKRLYDFLLRRGYSYDSIKKAYQLFLEEAENLEEEQE